MNFENIIKKRNILLIFLSLVIIIIPLQFILLDLALRIGFKPDDWILYFGYKTLGSHPLSQLPEVWAIRGIYTTYQVYYIGILENLIGFDYRSFQTIHVIFKSLATLAIFPVVLIIFKDKLLAILTTIFFAFTAASVGPLEFVVKGSDYVAIFWMCIFLIVYYLIVKRYPRNILLLLTGLILFILTLTFSPIRLFPLLILLPLTEIYLLVKNQNLDSFKNTLIRISVFFLPLIVLILHSPDSIIGLLQSPLGISKRIIEGNWHLILSPFSGIGYTFITNDYWGRIFGSLSIGSLEKYLYFLLGGPTVIFGTLTLIVAFLKSKRPWLFFLFTFILNFILEILVFFIATHYKYLPASVGLHYEPTGLYSALFGIYILVLGITCFIEWLKKDGGDNLLLALWIGPLFLFVFIFATWAFAPFGTGFSGTSYYLVVASIGSSLFISAFLLSIYYKVMYIKNLLLKLVFLLPIFMVIVSIFLMSSKEIHDRFTDFLANGRSAEGQRLIQGRFRDHIKDIDFTKPAFFYFDASDISGEGPFYSEGFLISFPFWMHFKGTKLVDGCVEIFYETRERLSALIEEKDGEKGFVYRGLCLESGKAGYRELFYKPENFYAFKLKNKDFINIKQEVLQELGLLQP